MSGTTLHRIVQYMAQTWPHRPSQHSIISTVLRQSAPDQSCHQSVQYKMGIKLNKTQNSKVIRSVLASVQLKIATRDFSKTAGLTPIFEVRIVIYDKKHVSNEFINIFKADYKPARHVPCFLPLVARCWQRWRDAPAPPVPRPRLISRTFSSDSRLHGR